MSTKSLDAGPVTIQNQNNNRQKPNLRNNYQRILKNTQVNTLQNMRGNKSPTEMIFQMIMFKKQWKH